MLLQGRPPIPFDVLSVDIGITPSKLVPGSSSIATPVKPISGYAHIVALLCLSKDRQHMTRCNVALSKGNAKRGNALQRFVHMLQYDAKRCSVVRQVVKAWRGTKAW